MRGFGTFFSGWSPSFQLTTFTKGGRCAIFRCLTPFARDSAPLDKLLSPPALHGLVPPHVLDPGWNITSHTLRSWKDEPCVRTATCNEIERKLPAVPAELPCSLSTDGGPSIESFFGSSEASSFRAARRTFEHKLAHGLQKLDWVQAIVRLFAARLVAFVLLAHAEHSDAAAGDHAEDAYLLAFVGRSPVPAQRDVWTDCRRIAGHVGPHAGRLAHVLGNGSVDSVRGRP